MALDYKNYKSVGNTASADFDAVGVLMDNGTVDKFSAPSNLDLLGAAEILATYQVGSDLEMAQSIANVIALLDLTVRANKVTAAKKAFAKEHGIKVSQVKVVKA